MGGLLVLVAFSIEFHQAANQFEQRKPATLRLYETFFKAACINSSTTPVIALLCMHTTRSKEMDVDEVFFPDTWA